MTAYTKAQISDIKVGSFVGVGASPQPDCSRKADSINIFPESAFHAAAGGEQRGNGVVTFPGNIRKKAK